MNPYEICPVFENEHYLLRAVEKSDDKELLSVYSDEKLTGEDAVYTDSYVLQKK